MHLGNATASLTFWTVPRFGFIFFVCFSSHWENEWKCRQFSSLVLLFVCILHWIIFDFIFTCILSKIASLLTHLAWMHTLPVLHVEFHYPDFSNKLLWIKRICPYLRETVSAHGSRTKHDPGRLARREFFNKILSRVRNLSFKYLQTFILKNMSPLNHFSRPSGQTTETLGPFQNTKGKYNFQSVSNW